MALVRENPRCRPRRRSPSGPGYSVRSIFERFPDLTALRVAVTDYAIARPAQCRPARPRCRPADPHQVAGRDRAPRPASDGCRCGACCRPIQRNRRDLQQRIRMIRQLIVMRMEMMFRPELSALSDDERREDRAVRSKSLHRFRELGAHARALRPVVRRGVRGWVKSIDRLLPPTPPPAMTTARRLRPPRVDGRRLRSERTRQLIIEAYLALLRENSRRCRPRRRSPSARAIPCARCSSAFPTCCRSASLRPTMPSPWRRPGTGARPRRRPVDAHPLAGRDRAARLARTGCRCGARSMPTRANRPSSSRASGWSRELIMQRLELMYRPELCGARRARAPQHPDRAGGAHRLRKLGAHAGALSACPFEQACALWSQTIDRLLPPTPAPDGYRSVTSGLLLQ